MTGTRQPSGVHFLKKDSFIYHIYTYQIYTKKVLWLTLVTGVLTRVYISRTLQTLALWRWPQKWSKLLCLQTFHAGFRRSNRQLGFFGHATQLQMCRFKPFIWMNAMIGMLIFWPLHDWLNRLSFIFTNLFHFWPLCSISFV